MRLTIVVALVLFVSCGKQQQQDLPAFKKNATIDDVWQPIEYLTRDKDFSIVRLEGGGFIDPSTLHHRIICLKDSTWEKIEYRRGITEVDTMYSVSDGELVYKEVALRKECRKGEGESILRELISQGLFELPEEEELIDACVEARDDRALPTSSDAGSIIFYIISGNKVRVLTYDDPYTKLEDCPTKESWEKVLAINKVFESNWFVKEH